MPDGKTAPETPDKQAKEMCRGSLVFVAFVNPNASPEAGAVRRGYPSHVPAGQIDRQYYVSACHRSPRSDS
jgi:hypothetical protein